VRELAKVLKALSDETRLRVVNLILERECCVCEVMQALGISQTRASRNLSLLCDAGLLERRKEGLWTLYSVNREDLPAHLAELLDAVHQTLATDRAAVQDRERLNRAERIGPECVRPANPDTRQAEEPTRSAAAEIGESNNR
jgi:ArsR family transcriptional regulator